MSRRKSNGNFGDFYPRIGTTASDDYATGIMLSFVRENGRAGVFAVGNVDGSSNYWIPVHRASSSAETNANFAAAHFPFAEGWLAGYARNSADGGAITTLNASPGINLGTEFVDHGTGQFEVYLPGVNSRTDGILLVNGAKNEANYALSTPSSDGSHFRIGVHDNNVNGAVYEQDPVAFAYVPLGAPNVTMGRILGNTTAPLSQGQFAIRPTGAGTYQLTIPGESPTSGVLLVSPEGFGGNNADNIVTYEANAGGWEIQSRDLNASPPGLQTPGATEGAFNFVFLPIANPPASAGTKPGYDASKVAAANYNVTEFNPNNGTNNGDMYAQVSGGSGGLGTYTNNLGDVYIARVGALATTATGVLLPTIREHERDNSATGGKSGYGMAAASSGIVHTHWAHNAGWAEQNIDFAVAFFPHTSGFDTGYNVATSGDTTTLTVAGSGDTRHSGVLVGTVYGNYDDFMTAEPLGDGSGWNVLTRYKSGSGTSSRPISYAFLPYGTENLVAGQVDANGYLSNKSGQFSLYREGTATAASMPEDTDFNFAFIGFDNPPTNPQLRSINPNALVAANLGVVQHDPGDTVTSVSAFAAQSTPGVTVHTADKGDYWLSVDGQALDASAGVLLSSVAQNGQFYVRLPGADARTDGLLFASHGKDENNYAMTRPATDGSEFIIHVHDNGVNGGGTEQDPVAFAYIPFGTPNLTMGRLNGVGAAIASQGEFAIRKAGTGTFELRIPGHDPTTGTLLVTGSAQGVSNDNIISYEAAGDYWLIQTQDLTPPTPQDLGAGDHLCEFAFIPHANAPTAPVARPTFDANKVAAANINITEFNNAGQANTLSVYGQVSEGSAGLGVYGGGNTGDIQIARLGNRLSYSDGVLLATVREHVRDNTATGSGSGYGVVTAWAGYYASTHRAESGDGEHNVDVAVALFPAAAGFAAASGEPTTGGTATLTIPGAGDTRRSGVLMATASENQPIFSTVEPLSDGSGWAVQVRRVTGALQTYPFNYAFLPYGTDNLVAGQVTDAGYLANKSGDFTLMREDTGLYRLSIPNESPKTGMLLLTATHSGASNDNTVTAGVRSDGAGWDIGVYDNEQNWGVYEDAAFSFLYLPLVDYRVFHVEGLIAGRVDDDGSLFPGTSVGDFELSRIGAGQYELLIDGQTPETGMLLLTVAKDAGAPEDNFLSYEAQRDGFGHLTGAFLIQSYDLQFTAGGYLQDTEFVFAFVSFDDPLTMGVPEPASVVLMALGALGLLACGRCRRRR